MAGGLDSNKTPVPKRDTDSNWKGLLQDPRLGSAREKRRSRPRRRDISPWLVKYMERINALSLEPAVPSAPVRVSTRRGQVFGSFTLCPPQRQLLLKNVGAGARGLSAESESGESAGRLLEGPAGPAPRPHGNPLGSKAAHSCFSGARHWESTLLVEGSPRINALTGSTRWTWRTGNGSTDLLAADDERRQTNLPKTTTGPRNVWTRQGALAPVEREVQHRKLDADLYPPLFTRPERFQPHSAVTELFHHYVQDPDPNRVHKEFLRMHPNPRKLWLRMATRDWEADAMGTLSVTASEVLVCDWNETCLGSRLLVCNGFVLASRLLTDDDDWGWVPLEITENCEVGDDA